MALFTQFQRRFVFMIIVLLLTFTVTACGSNASKTTTTSSTPSQSTAPTSTVISGQGASCPSQVIVTTPPSPPSVLLTPSAAKQIYVAHVGDTIEVDLPFGEAWTGPIHPARVLVMQNPAGYAWGNMCIWRFQARSTGTASLAFVGHALCKKGLHCFFSVNEADFTVTVK